MFKVPGNINVVKSQVAVRLQRVDTAQEKKHVLTEKLVEEARRTPNP